MAINSSSVEGLVAFRLRKASISGLAEADIAGRFGLPAVAGGLSAVVIVLSAVDDRLPAVPPRLPAVEAALPAMSKKNANDRFGHWLP